MDCPDHPVYDAAQFRCRFPGSADNTFHCCHNRMLWIVYIGDDRQSQHLYSGMNGCNHLYDGFQLFDYSDASVPNGNRTTSTVAPQALFLMNGELAADAAAALAQQLRSRNLDDGARISELYAVTLGREPSAAEQSTSVAFLGRFEAAVTLAANSRVESAAACPERY